MDDRESFSLITEFEYEIRGKYLNLYDRMDAKGGSDSLRFLGQTLFGGDLERSARECIIKMYHGTNIPRGMSIQARNINNAGENITFTF